MIVPVEHELSAAAAELIQQLLFERPVAEEHRALRAMVEREVHPFRPILLVREDHQATPIDLLNSLRVACNQA